MQISATRLCVILSSQFSNSAQLSALSGGGGGEEGGEGEDGSLQSPQNNCGQM